MGWVGAGARSFGDFNVLMFATGGSCLAKDEGIGMLDSMSRLELKSSGTSYEGPTTTDVDKRCRLYVFPRYTPYPCSGSFSVIVKKRN